MNILLELLFVTSVFADMLITFAVLESGKGVERAFARHYVKYPAFTVLITMIGVAVILLFVNLAQAFILLIPASVVFGYACWKNWRVLHG